MKKLYCLFYMILLVLLTACGKNDTCEDKFSKFCDYYGEIPNGVLYTSLAEEAEPGYMDFAFVAALYSADNGGNEYNHVKECCIYLGSSQNDFFEVGIFLCRSHSEAKQVAKMCKRRIEAVARARSEISDEAINLEVSENSFVTVFGSYTAYCITPNKEISEKALNHAM